VTPQTPPAEPPGDTPPPDLEQRRRDNDNLRQTLTERNRILEERETELRAERERITALERERDTFRSERDGARSEFDTFRRDSNRIDPLTDPEVMRMNGEFDQRVVSLDTSIAEDGGRVNELKRLFPDLLNRYKQIGATNSEGFEERRDEFNRAIRQSFPDHDREVRQLIRDGVDTQRKLTERINTITADGEKYRGERESQAYQRTVETWNQREREFFTPSADVRQNDPFNAEVICSELFGLTDQTKAAKTKLLEFVRAVVLPQTPINQADLNKMNDEDRARYLEGRSAGRAALQHKVQGMLPVAIASMQFLPGIYKRLMEAERTISELRGMAPPPPDGEDTAPPASSGDVKNFRPSNSILDDINKNG
jgi:hypothetical protein